MEQQRLTVLYIAMSLDGYISDESGGVGWLSEVEGAGDNGYAAFYATVDTILMGRATYAQIRKFDCDWPYTGKQCYVFTNQNLPPDPNVEFVSGDLSQFMNLIKSQSGSTIWLLGGAEIFATFMRKKWVDELMIAVTPVILGKGLPLFKRGISKTFLTLRNTEQYKDIIVLHYGIK